MVIKISRLKIKYIARQWGVCGLSWRGSVALVIECRVEAIQSKLVRVASGPCAFFINLPDSSILKIYK